MHKAMHFPTLLSVPVCVQNTLQPSVIPASDRLRQQMCLLDRVFMPGIPKHLQICCSSAIQVLGFQGSLKIAWAFTGGNCQKSPQKRMLRPPKGTFLVFLFAWLCRPQARRRKASSKPNNMGDTVPTSSTRSHRMLGHSTNNSSIPAYAPFTCALLWASTEFTGIQPQV